MTLLDEPDTKDERYIEYIEDILEAERDEILDSIAKMMGNKNATWEQKEQIAKAYWENELDFNFNEQQEMFLDEMRTCNLIVRDFDWFREDLYRKHADAEASYYE